MTELERLTLDRVHKARAELIQTRRFYGTLVTNVVPIISSAVRTAGTDSKHHFWNPQFVASIDQEELLGTQAHESEHDARHHSTRRNGRDMDEWNIVTDLAIYFDLKREGFKLPRAHEEFIAKVIKPEYDGKSAEEIYRIREIDREREQEQPSIAEDHGDGEEETESGGNGETSADETGDDETETESDANGGDNEDEDTNHGEPEPTNEAGDTEAESKPNGKGEGEGEGEGEASKGEPTPGPSCGDPGSCGEVLDAAPDEGETTADLDANWERVVRQAATMAEARGDLPGHVTREIERANNPTRDWRDELREFFDAGVLQHETWNKPNKRFVHQGLILPGHEREGVNHIGFLIDTSGSMDKVALALIRDNAQAALDSGVINKATVVYGDTRVTRVDQFETGDELVFDPRGGGGTELIPLFDYIDDVDEPVSGVVCFTDGFFEEVLRQRREPLAPTMFAFTGYPDNVKHHIATTPWHSAGIDIGAH